MDLKFWQKFSDKTKDKLQTIAANTVIEEQDNAVVIESGFSYYGQAFSGWGGDVARNDADLIKRYRALVTIPEVQYAVDDITSEAISSDTTEKTVELCLDAVDISDKLKQKITDEFNIVLKLMHFNTKGYDYFSNFIVDGRIGFHKIINPKNIKQGLISIKQFDSVALRKIRNVEREQDGTVKHYTESYVYDETLLTKTARRLRYQGKLIQLPVESVVYTHFDKFDPETGMLVGPLHNAMKHANNLSMLEDATVVYRYSRAPEKRVFYIDTGNLPPSKAESFVSRVMNRYKSKVIYDPVNGGIKDQKNLLTMYEDFWLPRSASGRGTEVTTLPGGTAMSDMDEVNYFRRKVYQALNIPLSRLESESTISFGRMAEITRDELKFSKYVDRMRRRFSEVFIDLLGTQLKLKNIVSESEWEEINNDIRFDYVQDSYVARKKEFESLLTRAEVMRDMEPLIGKYFSHEWIQKNIWFMSDDDIKQERHRIMKEKKDPLYSQIDDEGGFDFDDDVKKQPKTNTASEVDSVEKIETKKLSDTEWEKKDENSV